MTTITDELMMQMISQAKLYSIVLLKSGPNYGKPENQPIIGNMPVVISNFAKKDCSRLFALFPTKLI